MSSPNHPTSNTKDAFSSNSPNYTPASPDYSSASPRNTSSDSLNNSYGLVPIASPTLSLFHDDPYIKNSFFPRKYCHQRNEAVNDQFPLLLPYLKHLRWESYHKTSLERHEENIEKIMNRLNELSLDRIEYIDDKIKVLGNGQVIIQQDFENLETELQKDFYSRTNHQGCPGSPLIRYEAPFWIQSMSSRTAREDHHHQTTRLDSMAPKRTSTSAALAMTQAAIRQLVADSVAATLEAQAANMANTDNKNRNTRPRETPATRKCTYKEFMS
nr:hypothetical protein [Tanacetum cinerariifolium]